MVNLFQTWFKLFFSINFLLKKKKKKGIFKCSSSDYSCNPIKNYHAIIIKKKNVSKQMKPLKDNENSFWCFRWKKNCYYILINSNSSFHLWLLKMAGEYLAETLCLEQPKIRTTVWIDQSIMTILVV